MNHLPRVALKTVLLSLSIFSTPVLSGDAELQLLSSRLENALNTRNSSGLQQLISVENSKDFSEKYQKFLKDYPKAKWEVNPLNTINNQNDLLEIEITGEKKIGNHIYSLDVKQIIEVTIRNKKIISQKILNESSLLQTNKTNLPITLNIPNAVLTGSRYHIDLILDKPLGEAILAGGLISTSREEISNNLVPDIQLSPMISGGLFKTVQAPLKPGNQTWAIVLAHPKGIISVTKTVRIVSNSSEIYL